MGNPRCCLYTIGYLNFPDKHEFIDALLGKVVNVLIDVRTTPKSKFEWANKEELQNLYPPYIAYRHYPDLGGRPDDPGLYLDADKKRVNYDALIASKPFQDSIDKIIRGCEIGNSRGYFYKIAFMCCEKDKTKCHRFLAVAKAFEQRGFEINEILPRQH